MEVFYIGLGPFMGSGNVSCASGRCSLLCAGGNSCVTDPPSTGNKAPFGPAYTFDAAIATVKAARGFSLDFHLISRNDSGPNGATEGVDWGGNLTLEVYAPLAAGQEVMARTAYDLSAEWTNAEKGARVGVGVSERCDAAGRGVSSPGSGTASKSLAGNIDCILAADGSKTIDTAEGTFRLVQRLSFAMSAGLRFNDGMRSAGNGHIEFSFKPKGKELKAISGPVEGLAGADPSFPRPFVVKVFQNDTGAAVAGEPVVFQLKDLAGNAVGAVPTATAGTLADGTAAANFKVAVPGDYKVEATCAGCVEGSPVSFLVTVLSKAEATAIEVVQGNGDSGFFNERLPNGLTARIYNKVTGAPIGEVPVDFSIPPSQSCKGAQSFTAKHTRSVQRTGLAHTDVTLGDQEATCTAIATCSPPNCLPTAKSATFTFHVKRPPSQAIDNGAPGNPLSTGAGGPAPVGARRAAIPVDILFRVKTPIQNSPSPYRATRPPEDGYIGLLRGDKVGFKARAPLGSFLWSGFADGVSDVVPDMLVTAPEAKAANPANPATLTLHRVEGGDDALVRILVRTPPVDPLILRLADTSLREACDTRFPKTVPVVGGRTLYEIAAMSVSIFATCTAYQLAQNSTNFRICKIFNEEYERALLVANRRFEPRGRGRDVGCHNNCCDAAKHMYWHAAATHLIGAGFSNAFSISHEVQSQCESRNNEVVMDLHNNEVGQTLSGPLEDVEDKVIAATKSGRGLILWDTDNRNKTSPLVSSGQCGAL